MVKEQWQRIKEIVATVLEAPDSERAIRVEELCAGDTDLRREVETLLHASENAPSFLDHPAFFPPAEGLIPPSIAVGDKLGPYEILAPLGSGGMGDIWRARDTRLGRDVAIKTSRGTLSERSAREAEILSRLNHPHICQIYDVGRFYIVMELIVGTPLRGPLPFDQALQYARQICGALDAAHSHGIVHRDLKPANILVTRYGIKLLDFGLAKMPPQSSDPDGGATNSITRAGQIVGTLNYMSPEQLQGKAVDTRTDIFAFGLVLYEMLTGQQAFEGDNPASVIAAIIKGDPRPLTDLQPNLKDSVSRVLNLCLAKEPEDRWQSTRDLQRELEWLGHRPTVTTAKSSPRRIGKEALIALMIAATFAIAGWFFARRERPASPPWRITPLTAYAGNEEMPSISPDGTRVAFVWDGERHNNIDIYVKQIGDDAAPLRISTDEAVDYAPSWSPDGGKLAFLRQHGETCDLIVSSGLGGSERVLASLQYQPVLNVYSTISWSPDGKFIAAPDRSRIVAIDLDSREAHPLTTPLPPGSSDMMPSYSPDGRSVAFTRGSNLVSRQIWRQKLDRSGNPVGSPTRLTDGSDSYPGLAWMEARGSVMSARGFPGSLLETVTVPLDGSAARPIPVDSIAAWYPSYNAERRRLVYERRWLDLDIFRASLNKPKDPPAAVIASTHLDFALDVSADGKRIVFVSTRDGKPGIWRADRDGTNQMLLASFAQGPVGSPRWTLDGKWCVFDGARNQGSYLYAVSADGGTPKLLSPVGADESRPSVSPDGKWIYFGSPLSGRDEIWRRAWAGGPAIQITHNGGLQALPSADGKWLYFSRGEHNRFAGGLWRVPPAGGQETKVLDGITMGYWTVAGNLIYYLRLPPGEPSSVVEYDPGTRHSRTVYRFPSPVEPTYTVSSIGVSLVTGDLFVQNRVRFESDLVLVENFR